MELIEQLTAQAENIPSELSWKFLPARYCLFEWKDYYVVLPGVEKLLIGTQLKESIGGNVFLIRFENQLGLASIQPYTNSHPLCPPVHVEVISGKFPTAQEHQNFYYALLEDLFTRGSRLPFTISAPTARGVGESHLPPSPFFIYHFLCQYSSAIREALQVIQSSPHQHLVDLSEKVPLAQAREADADVLINILRNSSEWIPAHGFPLAEKLQGHAPALVWQRLPIESFDTPENQFVLHFLQQLLIATEALSDQSFWRLIPEDRKSIVNSMIGILQQGLSHPVFTEVSPMKRIPVESLVLSRRDGYREMMFFWQLFNHAHQPLFAHLQQAIDVRDIATLYEIWVFFKLVEEITCILGIPPAIDLKFTESGALNWQSEARYGTFGKLVYNQGQPSYSVPLRPDFAWLKNDQLTLVFDAKFRFVKRMLESGESSIEAEFISKHADIYKMHTYRDALNIQTAIAIYPGDTPVFYDKVKMRKIPVDLRDILMGQSEGVGALPMQPGE